METLKELINYQGNMYCLANIMMQQTVQLYESGDPILSKYNGKVVPATIDYVFHHIHRYQISQ